VYAFVGTRDGFTAMNLLCNGPQPVTETERIFSGDPARTRSCSRSIGPVEPALAGLTAQEPRDAAFEAYPRIVRPLLGRLLSIAGRILGDEVQAWDAVQEVLISFWLEREMPANPRAWLTRAIALRSLHLARSRARRRRHERLACERRPEASDWDDPSGQMEFEELTRTLNETFLTITPESRDVILLRMAARMDYASIAETLQIPIGTVRSRLHRTRQVFRAALTRKTIVDDEFDSSILRDL
jgi:RNA polymerase sigma-70 factor (ECF subfamily)